MRFHVSRKPHRGLLAILSAIFVTGCTSVPTLEVGTAVSVSQVVHRVRCELAEAVAPYWAARKRYDWLQRWTAGVDLTLVIEDRGGMTPSVAFIEPLKQVAMPGFGTFSRNFTFGLSAGVSTSATRNETISFALSLKELEGEVTAEACARPNVAGLNSELGLKEWVAAAFEPVEQGLLKKGHHKSPARGGGRRGARGAVATVSAERQLQPALALPDVPENSRLKRAMDQFDRDLARVRGQPEPSPKDIDELLSDIQVVLALLPSDPQDPQIRAFVDSLNRMRRELQGARAPRTKLDPPIESLSHQVEFVVALTGSVSPSWTLVRFRGPATTGSLASATRTRTHSLAIVLGDPGSDQTRSARQSLAIGTALRTLPSLAPLP